MSDASPNPLLSIVIPVRNDATRLRLCLEALRASTFRDYETIVVDDASTDQTPDVARELGAKVIKLDHNVGPAAARNRGAEAAAGTFLFFFDADVCVHPETVGLVADTFANDSSIAAMFGSYDLRPADQHFLSVYKNLFHHYVHQTGRENASTFWSGCGAIKKSVFLEMGGFDTGYSRPCIEDIELGARMIRAGHRIVLNKNVQVTHLKRWTLFGILKTDVLDRGVPWTQLILREKNLPNDLNLGFSQRVAAMFACLFVALVAIGFWFHPAWFALPVPLIAIVALNHRFYAFFVKQRSLWFAIRVLPMHVLYYLYSGAALAMGIASHVWNQRMKARPNIGPKPSVPEGPCPG
jgi:glycosyltransferase involved in cell wall biosynthesis